MFPTEWLTQHRRQLALGQKRIFGRPLFTFSCMRCNFYVHPRRQNTICTAACSPIQEMRVSVGQGLHLCMSISMQTAQYYIYIMHLYTYMYTKETYFARVYLCNFISMHLCMSVFVCVKAKIILYSRLYVLHIRTKLKGMFLVWVSNEIHTNGTWMWYIFVFNWVLLFYVMYRKL